MAPNRIRMLRGMSKLTQEALALRMGVTPRTVQRWEAGDVSIPDEKKLELAQVLGADISFLMGWSMPNLPMPDDGNGAKRAA